MGQNFSDRINSTFRISFLICTMIFSDFALSGNYDFILPTIFTVVPILYYQKILYMPILPKDIIQKTEQDFTEPERYVVKTILFGIYGRESAFYSNSAICRGVLYLANGNLQNIVNDILPMLRLDPRDFGSSAAYKANIPPAFLDIPFSEVEFHLEKIYGDREEPPTEIWEE